MDKYEIIKELGAGSFGVAHLCRDKQTDELVAIKFIERGLTIDENVEREIINHRKLRHPNIIRFKEVLLTPTHLALVMEYASGGELFERISQWGRLTEDEARYFFRQLISGVNYIHSKEICHRDLKLDNILLHGKKSPCLKICDFGYSKRMNRRDLNLRIVVIQGRKSIHMTKCDSCFSKGDLTLKSILLDDGSVAPLLKQMCDRDMVLNKTFQDGNPTKLLNDICHKYLKLENMISAGCLAQKLKEICNTDLMLVNSLLDGCQTSQLKKICCRYLAKNLSNESLTTKLKTCSLGCCKQTYSRELVLDNTLSDGCQAQQLKQICRRYLKLANNLLDGIQTSELKSCDYGFSKQMCNKDLMLDNTLLDGSSIMPQLKQICNRDLMVDNTLSVKCPASQLKICDLGSLKLQSKPYTNVGSATYTAPEVLRGRGYDGKMADVWSCGVTLYVMLVAAYPFEDPKDSESSSDKTIEQIMDKGYEIPDDVHISKECQHLLSSIFVQNPLKRISINEIMNHPWFLKNLESDLGEPTEEFSFYKMATFSLQSSREIMHIVMEARKPAQLSTTIMGYESNTEEDHEITMEEEELNTEEDHETTLVEVDSNTEEDHETTLEEEESNPEEDHETTLEEEESNPEEDHETTLEEEESNTQGDHKTTLEEMESNIEEDHETTLEEDESNTQEDHKSTLEEVESNIEENHETTLEEEEPNTQEDHETTLKEEESNTEEDH